MKDEAKTKLENLPTTQLCEFYIEVQEEETKVKDSRKEVRDEIINRMRDEGVIAFNASGKRLALESLSRWIYSPEVQHLESLLEAKKEIERKTGGAKPKACPYIRVKDIGGDSAKRRKKA
jgi:hypothetical protein